MQKQKPLPSRPRPFTLPLQPAPKAIGSHRTLELTDAEAGDLLRRLVALDTRIHKAQQQIAEARREQDTIFNQARLRFNPGIIEVCQLCGYRHDGECFE
jgi:hypothetical protein